MAKIAVNPNDPPAGPPSSRELAAAREWAISEVICSAGPHDTPFEEQHARTSVAVVVSGTFEYRTSTGSELMTPGSLLLGNAGDCFCCGHRHGTGDRCISFSFDPHAYDVPRFRTARLPATRATAPLVAKALSFLAGAAAMSAEELSLQMAAESAHLAQGLEARHVRADAGSLARVSRVIRMIDNDADSPQDLPSLVRIARLSRYHFLRVFEEITGSTPHQYVLRGRLRRAAVRLRTTDDSILNVALDSGFGDVSNFNRAFRTEFRATPRSYRRRP